MKTVAFMTQKGGAGKTTLVASLGVVAQESGERVFLIDLDPQGTLTSWGRRRRTETPAVDKITPDKLAAALKGLAAAGYTLAIIDTQGVDTPATAAAMEAADLSLIPTRPTAFDIEGAKPTVRALVRLGRPFAFVINQSPPMRSARLGEAAKALDLLGALAEPPIAQRTDHQDATGFGLGVTEHDPHGKAAEEVRALWAWMKQRMENRDG